MINFFALLVVQYVTSYNPLLIYDVVQCGVVQCVLRGADSRCCEMTLLIRAASDNYKSYVPTALVPSQQYILSLVIVCCRRTPRHCRVVRIRLARTPETVVHTLPPPPTPRRPPSRRAIRPCRARRSLRPACSRAGVGRPLLLPRWEATTPPLAAAMVAVVARVWPVLFSPRATPIVPPHRRITAFLYRSTPRTRALGPRRLAEGCRLARPRELSHMDSRCEA